MDDDNTAATDATDDNGQQKQSGEPADTATGEGSESPEEGAKAEKAADDAVIKD